MYTAEDYFDDVDPLGVDEAVLVATPHHGPGSPYVLDCVERYPDRLYGVVTLDLAGGDIPDQVDATVGRDRIVGVRVGGGELTGDAGLTPLWESLIDHGAQVQFLVSPRHLSAVDRVASAFPDLTVVIDHMGLRNVDGHAPGVEPYALESLAERPNIHVKLTSTPSAERFPHEDIHEHARYLYETFGPRRLLWGSDYIYRFRRVLPWQTREFIDHLGFLGPNDRDRILGRNMADLLD